MTEEERAKKQARYDELCAKEEITDVEIKERVQLSYELHPEDQRWRVTRPDMTPQDIWHAY